MLTHILPPRLPSVIMSSMGRSGSTLCFNAIAAAMAEHRFGLLGKTGRWSRKAVRAELWDLKDAGFENGTVYKTHALAHELPRTFAGKIVFTFGRASDAALSVVACRQRYGEAWIDEHFCHLRATGRFDELGERDVLRFEEQIDGWLNLEGHALFAIRYEALWDYQQQLSDFLGLEIKLPAKRQRQSFSLVDRTTTETFRATYAALDSKIDALPDFIVRQPVAVALAS